MSVVLATMRLQILIRFLNFRYERFCAGNGKVDIKFLPRCSNSLEFHTKRTNYQAALWRRSLDQEVEMPSPVRYGWKHSENNELEIDWGSQPLASEDILELLAFHCLIFLASICL